MSQPDFANEVEKLGAAIAYHIDAQGPALCKSQFNAALPLLYWLDYLRKSETTGSADELLNGARSVIVETAGCVSLGLVRPALFALRGQLDLFLSWLFFKDHPIEWELVQRSGRGFKLKRDILTFFDECIDRFTVRRSALTLAKLRKEDDPYRLLSAHVHTQSTLVMPEYGHLATLVSNEKRCNECVLIQKEVSEYLSDILLAYFAEKWASLPDDIVAPATIRLGRERTAKVFGD